MSNVNISIGEFTLGVPERLMFDVATLKVDLRPVITNLKDQSEKIQVKPVRHKYTPKHEHIFKSYYSKRKCIVCGVKKRKLPPLNLI